MGDDDIPMACVFVCLTDVRHIKILFDYAKCVKYYIPENCITHSFPKIIKYIKICYMYISTNCKPR